MRLGLATVIVAGLGVRPTGSAAQTKYIDRIRAAFGLGTIDFSVMHSELLGYTKLVLDLAHMPQLDIGGQVTAERRQRAAGAARCPLGI